MCESSTGNSGWPLNAFALPDGKPFFAGTYYSKPGWINLLKQIATAYKQQNKKVVLQAEALTKGIGDLEFSVLQNDSTYAVIDKRSYQNLFDSVYKKMDLVYGGIKGSPKFPMPSNLEFLLQYYLLTRDENALFAVTNTLTKMALGGIYDHLGGGFARYSIDSLWRVPHFEKMLYDNGQLMSLYAHAYQVTKNDFFKNIVNEIAAFVERELTLPEGGFYSSLNADTEEGEGGFYSWRNQEIKKIIGDQSADLILAYFNISEQGNWKKEKNILYASNTPQEFARINNLNQEAFTSVLATAKTALLQERNKREKPATDNKIITAWNALMLKGYLDAYAALGEQGFLNKALKNARFLENTMLKKDGSLFRNYANGKHSVPAFLDDYAFLARSFIRLYQLTFDKHWLSIARQLTDHALQNFYDPKSGMFFYTSTNATNIVRKLEIADNAIPSSNSVMAEVLYNLSIYFERDDYLKKSSLMLGKLSSQMKSGTVYYAQWCFLAGLFAHGTNEIAIMGKDALSKNHQLQQTYLPQAIFMGSEEEENLPLLENKLSPGKTLIYVCTNKTCKMPVTEVNAALTQLHKPVRLKQQNPKIAERGFY